MSLALSGPYNEFRAPVGRPGPLAARRSITIEAMKIYSVTRPIDATPETVWNILVDCKKYPEWHPNIEKVEGRIAAGEQIKLYTKLSPGRAFPIKVTELEPAAKMTWLGGLPLGLFKGERTFRLTPREGGVDFAMREELSGLMSPLMLRVMPDLTEAFEQFADGLKSRAES